MYCGDLGYRAKTFLEHMQGIPDVTPFEPTENPASWMLEAVGGGVQPNMMKASQCVNHWESSVANMEMQEELENVVPGENIATQPHYAVPLHKQLSVLHWRCKIIYWRRYASHSTPPFVYIMPAERFRSGVVTDGGWRLLSI